MYKTLTPDVFRQPAHLHYEFHLSYNKRKKTLTLEKVVFHDKYRMIRILKEIYTYSEVLEWEYDDLTFMDCVNKIKSDTHTSYKVAPYRS